MNSVFSAFKSSKNETKYKFSGKKISETSSYENLKHIREIGSSSKMSDLIDDVGDDTEVTPTIIDTLKFPVINNAAISSTKSSSLTTSPTSQSLNDIKHLCNGQTTETETNIWSPDNGSDMVDHIGSKMINANMIDCALSTTGGSKPTKIPSSSSSTTIKSISASESNLYKEHNGIDNCSNSSNSSKFSDIGDNDDRHMSTSPPCSSLENLSTAQTAMVVVPKANFSSEGDILSSCSNDHNSNHHNHHHNHSVNSASVACSLNDNTSNTIIPNYKPIIKVTNRSSDTNLVANKQQANRLQKRLSLSGIGNGSMPSVHGRPTSANGQKDAVKKTRLSTHQRNLSLDFRYVIIYFCILFV